MSAFIRSTQATNSPRSVGRVGSRTRWIRTPSAASSGGGSPLPPGGTGASPRGGPSPLANPVDSSALGDLLGRGLLAPPGQDVDVHLELDQRLRELADVA